MRRMIWLAVILVAFGGVAVADDGEMLRRNIPKTPELLTEHAALTMLELYVPAQTSDGTLDVPIVYNNVEGDEVDQRLFAKPLIGFYQDGYVEEVEGVGFSGHGERDAYAAVSLDDGVTWKKTNLSRSGDRSSFSIKSKKKWIPYPGDVVRLFAASDGSKALLVWASRYCTGGTPSYALVQEELDALDVLVGEEEGACEEIMDDLFTFDDNQCLYLEDYWGVAGSQGSSDLADEGYPEVGEVPYSCMWAARGTLEKVDFEGNYDPEGEAYAMIWRKAERLTSGRRDAHRMEAACVEGAGCVVTWQEDPDGIRPGEGEGPGEGWSGAIAHHQTDTWYSYISWDNFDLVDDGVDQMLGVPVTLEDWLSDGAPQVGIPMSIPVRLTDNAMCVDDGEDDHYCYTDFDENGTIDICASNVDLTIEEPVTGQPSAIPLVCVAEDGRLMRGNTASTRPRTNLRGYDSDGDGILDRAWVIMAYEENKGLGEEEYDAGLISASDPDGMTKVDMGKNIWYHTFDMFEPELVSQGLMLNQPAVYPEEFDALGSLVEEGSLGYKFMTIEPDPIYDTQAGITTTDLYQTEIARRFSLISQEADEIGPSGTVALAMWKQGIIRRGGPADVMARRFAVPDDFDPAVDNPFAYENMVCATVDGTEVEMAFNLGENPRYVKGFCPAPAIGLSNTTIVLGDGVEGCVDEETCALAFPWDEYFADIAGGTQLAKITEWRWCDEGTNFNIITAGHTEFSCVDSDIDDNSWDNPYDVAKGHRGFMEGDFIMLLYAWSPNWNANTVGHDNYNLYTRRSFDGGVTWTTLGTYTDTVGRTYGGNGTTTCEWMGQAGSVTEFPVCTTYGAGVFEQARNLSQLVGTQETILDPRYSPTRSDITAESLALLPVELGLVLPGEDWVTLDATRDPSRYFMVYETGDNTTVEEGEAEPLDLYYSRAVDWGDHYLVWAEMTDLSTCLPDASGEVDDPLAGTGFCNEFDWLEGSHLSQSGEGSVTANPAGDFFYALWNQDDLDKHEIVIGSDAWFRRVAFIDEYIPTVDDPTGPGTTDVDQDLYIADWDGGNDCNDNNPLINPGATEICDDGIDNNCDLVVDEGCGGGTCDPAGTPCTMAAADLCCSGLCHPRRLTCK